MTNDEVVCLSLSTGVRSRYRPSRVMARAGQGFLMVQTEA